MFIKLLRRSACHYKDRVFSGQKLRLRRQQTRLDALLAHVVRKGDTLWDITRLHGTTVSYLKEPNNLKGDRIQPGMSLKVPKPAEEESEIGDLIYPGQKVQLRQWALLSYATKSRLSKKVRLPRRTPLIPHSKATSKPANSIKLSIVKF